MEDNATLSGRERAGFPWMDLLWLVFLCGLAVLQPIVEIHKQLTLLGIGVFQIFEQRFIRIAGPRGRAYSVFIKILLSTLLVGHTGEINSSYYLIYYLPVVTAAMYFEAAQTMFWTALASIAYCSYLLPALKEYAFPDVDLTELAIRNLFFFLAALVVNRFVMENRRQGLRYQKLAETLSETNRRLEQAEAEARRSERLAALGQLSAGLAHELRNPLAIIKGSAEMLNKSLPSSEPLPAELAGNISSEVNRLNTLVTRFLNFARPSQLTKKATSITALVNQSLKAAQDRWPEAPLEIERNFASELPDVSLDADLCEQVFTNLFLNAYEAMKGTRGKICVSIGESRETQAAPGERRRGVLVEIEDNGPGIPAELREQIFNPFFTTKKDGVGLGLSIVSKIVDDHGGWIRVSGKPGRGACFRVFFPMPREVSNRKLLLSSLDRQL